MGQNEGLWGPQSSAIYIYIYDVYIYDVYIYICIYNSYTLCIIFENPSDCKKMLGPLFFCTFTCFMLGKKNGVPAVLIWQPCVTNTISFWGDLYINCLCNGWLILWAGLESQRPFFLLVCWECSLRSAPRSPKQPKPRVYHLRKVFYHVHNRYIYIYTYIYSKFKLMMITNNMALYGPNMGEHGALMGLNSLSLCLGVDGNYRLHKCVYIIRVANTC